MLARKITGALKRKSDALLGRLRPLEPVLEAMALRPYELHLELTNLCNANCVFCPYQFQERAHETMSDEVFDKALNDFCASGGGSLFFTPIVGDALIDRSSIDRVKAARARPEVDRINLITNAILVDRYGAEEIVTSGISTLTISIAGFDEAMYKRVYRSDQYKRVLKNVLALLQANHDHGKPLQMVIGLRPDRPIKEVMAYPDFQKVLAFDPALDFTWSFTTAGGRITREILPAEMRIRRAGAKSEPCVQTYNGPIVLPDGQVLGCSCVAAMDAVEDLRIGHILQNSLQDIWTGHRIEALRQSFGAETLNATCAACDMYRNLDLYRTAEGRARAEINERRHAGERVRRAQAEGAWAGG